MYAKICSIDLTWYTALQKLLTKHRSVSADLQHERRRRRLQNQPVQGRSLGWLIHYTQQLSLLLLLLSVTIDVLVPENDDLAIFDYQLPPADFERMRQEMIIQGEKEEGMAIRAYWQMARNEEVGMTAIWIRQRILR